ncbi:hypothetical protein [Roseivirga thermotolerans]|uniref:hypothetical protein n=1 Tax=Roseivirga thermotolerans TaxID=1758176 RepID=UPI00273EE7BA|nr:hypothetical protein [Roseivirga thermotolerans]
MRNRHSFLLSFLLIVVVSCSTQEEPIPEETPILPLLADFQVAQSKWVPRKLSIGYDTIDNHIVVSAKNEESLWYMILENNSRTIDFTRPFNTENYSLDYPDFFQATFRLNSSEPGGSIWMATNFNQLVRFEISEIYEDSGYKYCAGSIEIYTRGDQIPLTLRIAGNFKNVSYGTLAR